MKRLAQTIIMQLIPLAMGLIMTKPAAGISLNYANLIRLDGGGYSIDLTITNNQVGQVYIAAPVTLGSAAATSPPLPLYTSAAANSTITFTFPSSTGMPGQTVVFSLKGSYGPNESFFANFPVTLPYAAAKSVTLNPSTVIGGQSCNGTVTLNANAPPTGATVSLSSSNPVVAQVPSSVSVGGGASVQTFLVNTSPVASATSVTISATYGGVTKQASLTVQPLPTLKSIVLNPTTVCGSISSAATVNLIGKAPANGETINLSSSNTAVAQVPSSVNVQGGAITVTFMVTTSVVAATTSVTITASYNNVSQSAKLTVTPLLTLVGVDSSSVCGTNQPTGTVTLGSPAPSGGTIIHLSSSNPAVASVESAVTVAAGSSTANFTITTFYVSTDTTVGITATDGAAIQSAPLTVMAPELTSISINPCTITGLQSTSVTVTISCPAPSTGLSITLQSSNPSIAPVPENVTIAAGTTAATFTITAQLVATSTNVTITASDGTTKQSAVLTVLPLLASLSFDPSNLYSTQSSTGTIKLNGPAPTGGIAISLTSSNPAVVPVPASVTVPQGATTATFTITAKLVAANTNVTITVSDSVATQSANLSVVPLLASLSFDPTSVCGTQSSTGTIALNGPAPTGGIAISLTSSNAAAPVPASITVQAGARTATFTITAKLVANNTNVTLTASDGVANQSSTLTVIPLLAALTLDPPAVANGATVTGTVSINCAAPANGIAISLFSSNTWVAPVPATVTVPAGYTVAAFTIPTRLVASTAHITIRASDGVAIQAASPTVYPAAQYTLTDLGTLPGGTNSYAFGLNKYGQVVGYGDTETGDTHAFLYDGSVMNDLGILDGQNSYAYGISTSGSVAGYADTAEGDMSAFAYSSPGPMSPLAGLGGQNSQAFALSDTAQGLLIVGFSDTPIGDTHACVYSAGSTYDLSTLGGQNSYAFGVNAAGQIVGYSDTAIGDTHAFLYSNGTMTDLSTLGGQNSYAYGINAAGQAVGYSDTIYGDAHAFLFSNGAMSDLGTLFGGQNSSAYAINKGGQIVGCSDTEDGDTHAWVYTGQIVADLNDLLISNDAGWLLTAATGINDSGQIVGYGQVASATHAFLLTPVALSAPLLPVSGTITLQGCISAAIASQPITFEFRPTNGNASFSLTSTLASDGSFILTNVPVGSYQLAIKGAKWLQKVVPVDTTRGAVSGVTALLLTGDVNGDNQVNLADYVLLRNAYGSTSASVNWNANADLNGDGQVSLADYALLRNNFGLKGDI